MTTLIPPYAALIASLNITVWREVGAHVLESLARKLHAILSDPAASQVAQNSAVAQRKDAPPVSNRCTASNLTMLLAYLYAFGVAHCGLVYDMIRLLLEMFGRSSGGSELAVELLRVLLQACGFQLRSDDPEALKQVREAI